MCIWLSTAAADRSSPRRASPPPPPPFALLQPANLMAHFCQLCFKVTNGWMDDYKMLDKSLTPRLRAPAFCLQRMSSYGLGINLMMYTLPLCCLNSSLQLEEQRRGITQPRYRILYPPCTARMDTAVSFSLRASEAGK